MPKSELTKPTPTQLSRPSDIFSVMRDEMDRMFERFERGWPRLPGLISRGLGREGVMLPEVDVYEDQKQVTVEVDLPGVDEKDVSVTMADGVLTIKGEKKSEREEKEENYYLSERSYGAFERSLTLPDTIDENKIEAQFDKGVLKITVQKRPEAVKPEKKIEIKKVS